MIQTIVRPPAVAGMFYPSDARVLRQQIDELLQRVRTEKFQGQLLALISPHAGYMYSGFTAANGFKMLEGQQFDTVVIVSPSHREYFDKISVYNGGAYRTPLGDVVINAELRSALVKGEDLIITSEHGHREEHAVEVQLPFLQKVLGKFTILPVVMGDQRSEYCFLLGKKLATILSGQNALLIASTDLSHYYPYDVAVSLDQIIVKHVEQLDYEKLVVDLESERVEACGGGPIVAVLQASCELGANASKILHVCNSGDITGDHSGVVGYLSAAVLRIN